MRFGLTERERELIQGVFAQHPEILEAKIYGSRAKGNYRPNSDIDLVLYGKLSHALVATISGELDELPLPYLFDVQAFDLITLPALCEHIERVGQTIYQPREISSSQ
jgi:predicted nucleotidyltransferase